MTHSDQNLNDLDPRHLHTPIVDEDDMVVIAHCLAHFGASFAMMLEYYQKNKPGCIDEIETSQIKKWQTYEPLAESLLPSHFIESVNESLKLYETLKQVYSDPKRNEAAVLISDLILSEEPTPLQEMAAVKKAIDKTKPYLLDMIESPRYYDPLNPGYGRAPGFAARILASCKIQEAIPKIIEAIRYENFFTDEMMIESLEEYGEDAKDLLFHKLTAKPFSKENEKAAMVLTSLPIDSKLSKVALELLKDPDAYQHENLTAYLILACEKLEAKQDKEEFIQLIPKMTNQKQLLEEFNIIKKEIFSN